MRILVMGGGVIGSVYASMLIGAGHEVVVLARGARLADLQAHGLVLHNAESGDRTVLPVAAVGEVGPGEYFDVVLVAVRAEQLISTLPVLTALTDRSDVVFFGNTADQQGELVAALGGRALCGFPAVGGHRDGDVMRYVLISQQKTMLGEPNGSQTARVRHLREVFRDAGFPTVISASIADWLDGHAAFIVPIAAALYRVGVAPSQLAADRALLRVMVRATRQAFAALRSAGNTEVPANLRILYSLPTAFTVAYWRHVLESPRGELWFGAHCRAAPEEMWTLAQHLQRVVRKTGRATPDLDRLLSHEHAQSWTNSGTP